MCKSVKCLKKNIKKSEKMKKTAHILSGYKKLVYVSFQQSVCYILFLQQMQNKPCFFVFLTRKLTIKQSLIFLCFGLQISQLKTPKTIFSQVSFLAGVTPVPDQMPPGFVWIFNQDAGDAITSVVEKRSGRGRTSTVKNLEDIQKLKDQGQC